MVGIITRSIRVLAESFLLVWFFLPVYEQFRQDNPAMNLPEANSTLGVFVTTIIVDLLLWN